MGIMMRNVNVRQHILWLLFTAVVVLVLPVEAQQTNISFLEAAMPQLEWSGELGTALSPSEEYVVGALQVATKDCKPNTVQPVPLLVSSEQFNAANSVAFSPDGTILASGWDDTTIKLWDVASGHLLHTLTGHADHVISVAFSPDGKTLASGSDLNWVDDEATIKIWDVASGKLLQDFADHMPVKSVAFTRNGQVLVAGSGFEIKLWEASSGILLRTFSGHTNSVETIALSPDEHTLASGSWDGTIKLWNMENGNLLYDLAGKTSMFHPTAQPINSVAFSPNGDMLASESWDDTLKIWDPKTGDLLHTFTHDSKVNVYAVAFSPQGSILAAGLGNGIVELWDVDSASLLRTLTDNEDAVYTLAFSPDGTILASGSNDGTILLWNVSTGKLLCTLKGHTRGGESAFKLNHKTRKETACAQNRRLFT